MSEIVERFKQFISPTGLSYGRIVFGYLTSPIIVILLFVAVDAVRKGGIPKFYNLLIAILISAPFAYLMTALLGFPAILLYSTLKFTNGILYTFGGAFLGILMAALFHYGLGFSWFNLEQYAYCSLLGAVTAFVFWMIVFKLRI